ncbi:cytochrome c oxidase assembly protein [Aquibacillus salsiterrae]|uniref:Cytochrome c oxidase assembly protein n=1 Tax=Aquibacillus salsiterrae TaxID=2950439 RepID=A0A9X3WCN1_9BACI|nr:cytochrome c oxidase assembly protein [Aquibacillus salsiterrae]MDC3416193.1 cytochrome c oxidase assembly protein [Aquibacillus salsiterrae]
MFGQVMSSYDFTDFWDLKWMILAGLIGAIYLLLTGTFRKYFEQSKPVKLYRKVLFLSGIVIGYITIGGPLSILSSYLFSVHMLSMSLLYFVMPPLIFFGIPDWMLRPLFNVGVIKKIVTACNRPWIIVVVFNALVSFYHFPIIFDYFTENPGLGLLARTIMLIMAYCMWWNIICPLPEMELFSDLLKLGYILLNVVLLYPVCVMIMFSSSLMFHAYTGVPQLFGFLPPLEDQRAGGIFMNVIQEFTLAIILLPIVYRWVQKQKALHHKVDPLPSEDNGK